MSRKKIKSCYMCNNGRIDEELTERNDMGCFSIGDFPMKKRLMLCTGNGIPLRIEYEEWNDQARVWQLIGIYFPKCCPNCGRKIEEYDIERISEI